MQKRLKLADNTVRSIRPSQNCTRFTVHAASSALEKRSIGKLNYRGMLRIQSVFKCVHDWRVYTILSNRLSRTSCSILCYLALLLSSFRLLSSLLRSLENYLLIHPGNKSCRERCNEMRVKISGLSCSEYLRAILSHHYKYHVGRRNLCFIRLPSISPKSFNLSFCILSLLISFFPLL